MATHAFPLDRPARSDARASSRHASLTRGAVTATALPSLDRTSAQVTPAASRTELAPSSRLQYDFSRMRVHEAKPPPGAGESVRKLLDRAYTESATPLPAALQTALGDRAAADFSDVRVHAGASSAAAAERLGARAYTLGRDVHLGHDAQSLAGSDRERLLAHEAVHAAQQGASPVRPHDGLQLGRPDSAAETEASSIAASLCAQGGSPSLALRDRLRGPPMALRQKVDPQIQRDLKGPYKAIDGTFNLNLKTESHAGAKNGMSGTIKFKASDVAPDAAQIRLLQIARDEDLTTGKEYEWTGDEANRMKVMTAADKGVDPGFFVDAIHKNRTPRTAKTDAPVSPYYIDDYKALADPNNADGSKKGKAISEASLWDYPGSSGNRRFTFETAAQNPANGYVYATLSWGFTIRDASKGKVESEHAAVNDFPTGTFGAAVKSFNEFYKNPGSSKAPT